MTTIAQSDEAGSAPLTVNTTTWNNGVTISTNGLIIIGSGGLTPVPVDLMVTVGFTVPNSAPVAQPNYSAPVVEVYAAITEDGTHYTDNDQYFGTNNSQTSLSTPTNFYGPFSVWVPRQNYVAYDVIASVVDQLLNGRLPRGIGFILRNLTGLTLTAPLVTYTPIGFTNT